MGNEYRFQKVNKKFFNFQIFHFHHYKNYMLYDKKNEVQHWLIFQEIFNLDIIKINI